MPDPAPSGRRPASLHVVRPGESMSVIARDHGVPIHSLIAANPQLANPNLIRAGQTIHLPHGAHAHGGAHRAGAGAAATHHPAARQALAHPVQQRAPAAHRPPPINGPSPAAGVSAAGFAFIYGQEHVTGISEHLHWPKGSSGVTLGSGYDMRHRSPDQIVRELTATGVPPDQAAAASRASGLHDSDARDFAASNHDAVVLSPDQEKRLLATSIASAVATVAQTVKVPLTQNQHDALVSLVFNIGDPHFRSSSVLRKLNDGDMAGAAEAFKMWNKSGGKVSPVLVRRRDLEVAMFNRPDASGPRAVLPASPARAGTPLHHAGAAGASGADGSRFADIIRRRGDRKAQAALDAGQIVIVGVRTPTRLDVNNGNGAYDDTMAIVRKAGSGVEAQAFRANTEPSTQYLHGAHRAPDSNRDGKADLGQMEAGQTVHYRLGTFLGHAALKVDGAQMIRVRRDVNQDRVMDAKDPVSAVAGAGGMHIHIGGIANTWSAGCQTLPKPEHARFFNLLHQWAPQQKDFYYVLVDGG